MGPGLDLGLELGLGLQLILELESELELGNLSRPGLGLGIELGPVMGMGVWSTLRSGLGRGLGLRCWGWDGGLGRGLD